jgi:membrane associated rhomboid family serine protease
MLAGGFELSFGFPDFIRYLSLSSDLVTDIKHPWVIITHMFVHVGFWHFLFNMLFLYWFGRIVGDFLGDRRVLPLYLLAGFFGALVFLITAPFYASTPVIAMGASAAVMGIIAAAGAIAPDYIFRLLFIGDVKLKYIVFGLLLLDLIGIANMSNTGGHFAHIGGFIFGYGFVHMLRQGTDISEPVNHLIKKMHSIFTTSDPASSRKSKAKVFVRHKSAEIKAKAGKKRTVVEKNHQEKLDDILDKIKASGYDSLNAEEKEFLFQASKKE